MNVIKGDLIYIGVNENSKGVCFHRTGITFQEAKKYDKTLIEEDYNCLLGITPIPIKEIGKYEKSEKTEIYDKKFKKKFNDKSY
jgi:hypothetical protein